tara:strand:+ start:22189 stop:23079 length:891 start_codon:yes stop_codon:yes gene_type:complete
MIFLLHGKKNSKQINAQIQCFIKELYNKKYTVLYTTSFYKHIKKDIAKYNNHSIRTISSIDEINGKIDYLICFGGDGTILDASTIVKNSETPIVGINTGRLGFLATISKNKLSTLLDSLTNKNYKLSKRTLLNIASNNNIIQNPFALNEISICAKENTSMINIKVLLNEEYLNTYWADGVIVSTPTGSTGYSLSCGGPIIMPGSNNFVITPIAPHNLNVRPLVISDEHVITIEVLDKNIRKYLLSMDSRSQYINKNLSIRIKKASYNIKLVEIDSINYSKTLREKLLWGLDKRNNE